MFVLSYGSLLAICRYFKTGWWLIMLALIITALWLFLLVSVRFTNDRGFILQITYAKGITEFIFTLGLFFVRRREVTMLFSSLAVALILLRLRPMVMGYLADSYGISYNSTAMLTMLPTVVLLILNVKMYRLIRREKNDTDQTIERLAGHLQS